MSEQRPEAYVGPRPFTAADRSLFFGRDLEAADLLALVKFHRVVLLYAQSGAGKSSLINTKIVPGLAASGYAPLPVVRVRGIPANDLSAGGNAFVSNIRYQLNGADSSGPPPFGTLLEAIGRASAHDLEQGPVLVIDQFEELFTSYQDRWAERSDLFRQLDDALAAKSTFRVLLSMREDYIAELDPLVWNLRNGIGARYRVELLRREQAVAAVKGPAATRGVSFDEKAADQLVDELSKINVEDKIEPVKGEYIEPVQLQIVCKRLWDRLPPTVDAITTEQLVKFGDANEALNEFYLAAVRNASEKERYPEKLIHLGCIQFVTASGTRGLVPLDGQVVGRLPVRVADSLVDQHFLRRESRSGALWYEISHDRLIKPVLDKKTRDEELRKLLHARELLDAALPHWKDERGFDKETFILVELREVEKDLILSDDELQFLTMNSIGAGCDIPAWTRRLRDRRPDVLQSILHNAAAQDDLQLRRNCATGLAEAESDSTDHELVRLAIDDADAETRRQAALAVAQADRPKLYDAVAAYLAGSRRRQSLTALAVIWDDNLMSQRTEHFSRLLASLHAIDKAALVLRLAAVRIGRRWPLIFYVGIIAAFFAGLYCGAARILPTAFLGTIIANMPEGIFIGIGAGLFQGMTGGVMWGLVTSVSLAIGWILFRSPGREWERYRVMTNVVFGILGGIVGGIGVVAEVWFMFSTPSKLGIHWILNGPPSLAECIYVTRYCSFYPVLGPAFGAGMGLAAAWLFKLSGWEQFLETYTTAEGAKAQRITNRRQASIRAFKVSARYSIITGVLLFASAILFEPFLFAPPALSTGESSVMMRVLGETFAVWIGNIGGAFGIAIALLIMRVGVNIAPYTD
jgi:hypothetical protein